MAQQTVNIGAAPNDGTGDTIRAGGQKINDNFGELYATKPSGTNTGDQTSIVGITGTLAQFNTACTDADFASGGGTATGTNTGDQTSVSGNSGTATALQTGRAINGVTFDGTANITVAAAAGTLTGNTLAAGVTASSLTSLGTIASLAATAGTVANTPSNPTDIANKAYVDGAFAGFSPRSSCRLSTTAALNATYVNGSSGVGATLTNAGALAALTVDGVSVAAGDRILVKNQASTFQNGIYSATTVGSGILAWVLTRTGDYDQSAEIFEGTYTDVIEGTANAETQWNETTAGTITVGTTAIVFAELLVAQQTVTLTGDVTGSGAGSIATTIAAGAVQLATDVSGTLAAAQFPALSGDVSTSAGSLVTAIGAGKVTRAMLAADAKNWTLLGIATATNAVRTGTITWTGTFDELEFTYYISGYSNAAIGRLIVGPTAGLSETATNHCCSLIEGVTLTATSVSIPGWPTAVTVNNVPRWGMMRVKNVAAEVKSMWGQGIHAGTAATAVPLQMQFGGLMSDATNAINKAELAVYAAITGTAISAITFTAAFLRVRGRSSD